MDIKPAYYLPTGHNAFRKGQPAMILGVVLATPAGQEERACFHLKWPDGFEDYAPVADNPPQYTFYPKWDEKVDVHAQHILMPTGELKTTVEIKGDTVEARFIDDPVCPSCDEFCEKRADWNRSKWELHWGCQACDVLLHEIPWPFGDREMTIEEMSEAGYWTEADG